MDAECRWEEAEGGWLGLKKDLSGLISPQTEQINLFLTHRCTHWYVYLALFALPTALSLPLKVAQGKTMLSSRREEEKEQLRVKEEE